MLPPTEGPRRLAVLGVLALLSLAGATGLRAQAPPPDATWRTFRTEHFRVTFTPELEEVARRAAAAGERAHAVLRAELAAAPEGPIDLVVTDHVDLTNGYATPFPSNRIVVFARPPLDLPQLAYTRDWIELVVSHEVVHIFHLDVAGPVGHAIRAVFGRVPLFWPVFPVLGTPAWSIEGLATHYESRLTGAGRVHGSFHDMVVRAAALDEEGIPDLDDVSTPSPVWPGGQRSYVYGASFMRWLAEEYGPEVHAALVEETAHAELPPFLFFGSVAEKVTDHDFEELYDAWRAAAGDSARAVRDRLRRRGVTEAEPVVAARRGAGDAAGPFAVAPRVSPDGRRVAFSADDFRSAPATRLLDLATGDARTLAERNQAGMLLGPASWLPDGSGLITAQLEFRDRYRLFSDLWHVGMDGTETRLTDGARLGQPDVAADGRRVVAVQDHGSALRLVVRDLTTGRMRVLADARPGEGFAGPRWSPDGRSVAAARFRDGRVDLVVVDVATGEITPLTADPALDMAPAWTPGGRWILFWSDRTGIPNLYAVDALSGGPPWQVTNVIGGAFDPDVSADGRWIYFSAYGPDGWRIARIPLEPGSWTPAPSSSLVRGDGEMAPAGAPVTTSAVLPYSPWPSAAPQFWLPTYTSESGGGIGALHFLGAYAAGWDVLQRHMWQATAAFEPGSGRFLGDMSWTWRGLGQPELTFSVRRDWSRGGVISVPTPGPGAGVVPEVLWLHEESAAIDALFLRPRWRGTAWLTAGAEVLGRGFDLHRGGDQGDAILATLDLPPLPTLVGAAAGAGWRNARTYPYSISLEDGAALSLGARRWWRADRLARAYDQLRGRAAAYLGFPAWGFADHVVAGRLSALARLGDGATPTSIGGAGGSAVTLLDGGTPGVAGTFLPVRGYDSGDRIGTRAWTASAEYRVPLHLQGWSGGILGLSITALSGSLFADAGDAWCPEADGGTPAFPGCTTAPGDPLLSAGAELSLDFGVLHSVPLRFRGGVAVPFTDLDPTDGRPSTHPRNWRFHLAIGPSF